MPNHEQAIHIILGEEMRLMTLTNVNPGDSITFAMGVLSQYMHDP